MTDQTPSKKLPYFASGMRWPKAVSAKNKLRLKPPSREEIIATMADQPLVTDGSVISSGSITSRPTTPREKFMDVLGSIYGGDPEARHRIDNLMIYADFFGAPLFGAYDAPVALAKGQYIDAAISSTNAAAPFLGKPIRLVADAMKRQRSAGKIADGLATSSPPQLDSESIRAKNELISHPTSALEASNPQATSEFASPPPMVGHYKTAASKPVNKLETPRELSESAGFWVPKPAIQGRRMFWEHSEPRLTSRGPLARSPRLFSADYPHGARSDAAGNLLEDIEGRPLTAKKIAGRRKLDGKDEPLTVKDILSLVEDDMGVEIRRVPRDYLIGGKRSLGDAWYHIDRGPELIQIWDALPEDQAERTLGHEAGHMLHFIADEFSNKGLEDELGWLYSEARTGQRNPHQLLRPQDLGYTDAEAPREQIAEAYRIYKTQPNTMKVIAPKTAAFFRTFNNHPFFKKNLQFNNIPTGAAVGAGATALAGRENKSQASEVDQKAAWKTNTFATPSTNPNNVRKAESALQALGFVPLQPISRPLDSVVRALWNKRNSALSSQR